MAASSPMHQAGKRAVAGWGDRIDGSEVMETWPSGPGGEVQVVRGVASCSDALAWAEYRAALKATADEVVRRRWSGAARRNARAILKR